MKNILIIILLLKFILNANGQVSLQGPKNPLLVNVQFAGCLSCKGTEWSNPDYAGQEDSVFTEANLMGNGFCFQSSCYYARGLMPGNYGFFIPANAVILGIRSEVLRKADTANCIMDTIVQLFSNGAVYGLNKADPNYWPDSSVWISYGDSSDLWGASWTPIDINMIDFGLLFTPLNKSTSGSNIAFVDAIRISVWYQLGTGTTKDLSSDKPFHFYYNQTGKFLWIDLDDKTNISKLEILSSTGQLIKHEKINHEGEINVNVDLQKGIYIARFISDKQIFSDLFIVNDE